MTYLMSKRLVQISKTLNDIANKAIP
jgi:hypothetical protein